MNRISLFVGAFIAMLGGCAVDVGPEAELASAGGVVGEMATGNVPGDDADYFAGSLPDELVDGVVASLDRRPFEAALVAQLYGYGEDNPDDGRPWLLLAGDAMRAEDWTRATDSYWRAIDSDPQGVKAIPNVLSDLVFIASLDGSQGELARKLITREYGQDALPVIEATLEGMHAQGDRDRAFWLGELRRSIEG